MLKKFKIPREDPVSWQLGLVEREINTILRGEENRRNIRLGQSLLWMFRARNIFVDFNYLHYKPENVNSSLKMSSLSAQDKV